MLGSENIQPENGEGMARRITEEVLCDMCGSSEGVVRVTVNRPANIIIIDLCTEHQAILDEWDEAAQGERGPAPRPEALRGHRVDPID